MYFYTYLKLYICYLDRYEYHYNYIFKFNILSLSEDLVYKLL